MATITMAKYEGRVVRLGGEDYVVPPLALGAIRKLLPTINAIQAAGGAMTPEMIDGVIDVAYAALGRNYPSLTRDEVADLIDVATMSDVMEAVVRSSGLVAKNVEASPVETTAP